jgi:predicted nucleic acid-binding Zn ribbon protein
MSLKNCRTCNKIFDAKGRALTCSTKCRIITEEDKKRIYAKQLAWCEKNQDKVKGYFKEWYYKNRPPKTALMSCKICSKTFERKNGNQKFCSDECTKTSRKNTRKIWIATKGRKKQRDFYNKYRLTDKGRDAQNSYRKKRLKNDPLFKLRTSLSNLVNTKIRSALKSKKPETDWKKQKSTLKIIGCNLEELKSHLEKQFKQGMTWSNHSLKGWHVDHIIPLSSAKSIEELEKLSHYTNLQPLWAKENQRKGDKY